MLENQEPKGWKVLEKGQYGQWYWIRWMKFNKRPADWKIFPVYFPSSRFPIAKITNHLWQIQEGSGQGHPTIGSSQLWPCFSPWRVEITKLWLSATQRETFVIEKQHGQTWLSHIPCSSFNLTYLQGLVDVQIKHHPTIGDIISNKYLKVMYKIPKKGHLPTPDLACIKMP